jgi:hypothetical protein
VCYMIEILTNSIPTVQAGDTWGILPIQRTTPNSGTSPSLNQAILSPKDKTGASGSS